MKLLVAVGLLLVVLQVFAEETNSEDASIVAKRGLRLPAYRHVGCFRDRHRRAIPFLGGVPRVGAVKACANKARIQGFTWFAVQYRTHCFAGRTAYLTYNTYGNARNCHNGVGGAWANDVYRFIRRIPYVSLGCYKDKHARALPVFLGYRPGKIEWCARMAKSRGYKVFSVQYNGHCFSGPTAQRTYGKYGASNRCRHGKGGAWANNVYRLTARQGARKFRKLNRGQVCFQARGNRPGIVRYYGPNRIAKGVLLVYRGGRVTCHYRSWSRWGCGDANLNVVVTDQYNYMIYPRREYVHHWAGLWYRLPGKHSRSSKTLFLTNVGYPFHLTRNMLLKVWYGEDLKNWTEGDNRGRVCVDVYAWFA